MEATVNSTPRQEVAQEYPRNQRSAAREIAARAWAFSGVPLGILFLAAAGYALAEFATVAAVDLDFALNRPGYGVGLQAAAFVYLLGAGVSGAWRIRRKLALIVPVLWLPVGLAVWYVNTQTHEATRQEMFLEVLPAVSEIRRGLEAAQKAGASPKTVQELAELGYLKDATKLDRRFFGPEAYSYSVVWDGKGLEVVIRIAGDPSRNVPDWVATFEGNSGGRLEDGDIRPNLPVIERPRSSRARP